MSVSEQVRQFLQRNFLLTEGEFRLQDDASLLEAGVVDSTGILEVILFVEESFGLEVPDSDVVPENFDSVARIAAYVQRRCGAQAGGNGHPSGPA